ncbi:MAG: radical SAM protein [Fibrobacter sp.]|nr:radical SAM protein [Fibrobacter sp.]
MVKCLNKPDHLSWVDEYMRNVKEYLSVRLEDNLLIKRPNIIHKLNPSGAVILNRLLNGLSIYKLFKEIPDHSRQTQIIEFLTAIRAAVDGIDLSVTSNTAVETKLFSGPLHKLPVLSEIAITYACNLKCSFCYAGCGQCQSNTSDTMTENQIKRVLNIIRKDALVPSVSFTGGEPATVRFLQNLIQYATNLGMRVNLITNGTLIDSKLAKQLVKSGLKSVQVSLEGSSADIHEKLTQVSGSFQKTCDGIRALQETGIHVHTNTTLTTINAETALEFPHFIKKQFGLQRFSMNLMIPAGSGIANENLWLSYSNAGNLIDRIKKVSDSAGVDFMWYSPVPLCIFNTIANGLGAKGCSACDGLLSVAPNGDVLPCSSYPQPVGNLLKTRFQEIWNDNCTTFFRNKSEAPSQCFSCDNFALCNGACPLYWKNCGTAELSKHSQRLQEK